MAPEPSLISRAHDVVVLRALAGIGDHLCTIPALRTLRAGLPQAHVAVLTVPGAEAVLSRFPEYVDELIPFAGFPGIPEKTFTPGDLPRFYQKMVDRRFDLALQMQGNGLIANSLVAMLGARVTAGYRLPGQYCPDEKRFIAYPAHLPEVRRHLALLESLGLSGQGEHLEFPVGAGDRDEARRLLQKSGALDGTSGEAAAGYACLHPGGSAPERRWPPAGFAAVADELVGWGLVVVFTGRPEERELVGRVRHLMRRPAVDLTGKTSLGGLATLLEGSALLVCNDTGVSHLAAALRVPSVVIFAGTAADGSDPRRWAPLDGERHVVVARRPDAGAAAAGPPVPLIRVLDAVRRQLARRPARPCERPAAQAALTLRTADVG